MSTADTTIREKLIIPCAIVVCIAWLVSLYSAAVKNEYAPLTITTPAMLMLLGYVFGVSIVKSATEKKDD
jgi:hypothetical protein